MVASPCQFETGGAIAAPPFKSRISELEFFDVCRRHDVRGSEKNFAFGSNLVGTKPAGFEGLALLARQFALRDGLGGVVGQIAEVLDVPPDVLDRAVLDVLLDQCRWRQTSQLYLAEKTRLIH